MGAFLARPGQSGQLALRAQHGQLVLPALRVLCAMHVFHALCVRRTLHTLQIRRTLPTLRILHILCILRILHILCTSGALRAQNRQQVVPEAELQVHRTHLLRLHEVQHENARKTPPDQPVQHLRRLPLHLPLQLPLHRIHEPVHPRRHPPHQLHQLLERGQRREGVLDEREAERVEAGAGGRSFLSKERPDLSRGPNR